MTIQFLFVLRTISPCLATVLLFYRKNAFSMFAAPLLFISIAEAQPSVARRFLVVQKPFTYSCAIKSGITGLVPAVKIASGRARIVDRKWIAREIRALRTQRRLLSRFKKHPRVTAQATLASRLLIVKNFADRCASLTATVCDDGFKHSKVEDGIDCGQACGVSCSQPRPTPLITVSPTPIRTVAQTSTRTPVPTITPAPTNTIPSNMLKTECFDGIDNNSDGLTDNGSGNFSAADFGCFGPNGQESQFNYGFGLVTPSTDTRIVYVSSSEGNDSNTGLSALAPKRTLNAGYSLLRNGYPDWLLLKRGDTFDGSDWRQRLGRILGSNIEGDYTWHISGRSNSEKMVIGSYGISTQRPIIIADNALGAATNTRVGLDLTNVKNIYVTGLDFYAAPCDPNSSRFAETGCAIGIKVYSNSENIRIEDNRVRYFGLGITVQAASDPPAPPRADQRWNNVVLHRNSISHSYHSIAHSQGIFASSEGRLTISDNVLYRNGWNDEIKLAIRPATFVRDTWRAVADGRITFRVNGTNYALQGLNFSAINTYDDVTSIINAALRAATPPSADVSLRWHARNMVLRTSLPSNDLYGLSENLSGGTNLALPAFLNVSGGNPSKTSADMFNRNMYLTQNRSNYVVEGNLVSRGASGGIQLRMGGILRGNVALAEPVGMSVGHFQNYGESFTAHIADNVVLGAANIGTLGFGFGIGIAGQGFLVERNIVANNEEGTDNIEGLFSDTDASNAAEIYQSGLIRNNIVYNWKSPSGRGAAMALRHDNFSDVLLENNVFAQPFGGSLIGFRTTAPVVGLLWDINTAFAANTASGVPLFSIAGQAYTLGQFQNTVGGNWSTSPPTFPAPNRTIANYLIDRSLGGSTVDDFMELALTQSRQNWAPELTARAVRNYIYEGFGLTTWVEN